MAQLNTNKPLCFVFVLVMLLLVNKGIAQPLANFNTSTSSEGCFPLVVNFNDLSTGNPTSWKWNLGNGAISTQQHPTAVYFNPGLYTVTLTVSNASGSNTMTKTQYISVYAKPDVNFKASDSTGCIPLKVSFTDLSTAGSGTIALREWDFGDGYTSTLANPEHVYTKTGNYSVVLKVTNSNGCVKVFGKSRYIKVPEQIKAGFGNSTPVQCKAPETISFNNTSVGPGIISYLWDFGDGNASREHSPSHNYLKGGQYSVTLIASSSLGCADTIKKENILTIRKLDNTIDGPDSVCQGSSATFKNISIPAALATTWSFTDTLMIGSEVTKTWSTPGTYIVKLENIYEDCADTIIKTITVNPLPVVDFIADDSTACAAPLKVNFKDLSTDAVSWLWNFGDYASGGELGSSIEQNPSYTYNYLGRSPVTLTVKNVFGCTSSMIKYEYIKVVKPIVKIQTGTTGGCVPFGFSPYASTVSFDGVKSYLWDFGNGKTSTLPNPLNVYDAIGKYTVTLLITTNDGCTASDTLKDVKAGTKPTPNFTTSSTARCGGAEIQFTDQSVPADEWLWDFGDGKTSTEKNPLRAYSDTGNFSVTLSVKNSGCLSTIKKNQLIKVFPSISRFTPVYDCVNKKHVTFKDSSVLPQSWFWDFGDGATSTLQNPDHIYATLGKYTVSLTTTNGACSYTNKQDIVLIDETPTSFTRSTGPSVCINTPITFNATGVNPENISGYSWVWGDGNTNDVTTPEIIYAYTTTGTFPVKLVNTDLHGCKDSLQVNDYIHIYGPVAGFTPSRLAGCRPDNVLFIDNSVPDPSFAITKWEWNYKDGTIDSLTKGSANHVFSKTGNFFVKLTVTDAQGCSDSAVVSTALYITEPKAGFTSENILTCVGSDVGFINFSSGDTLVYNWDLGNGFTSAEISPVTTYPADGDYPVKLFVTDINGCKDSAVYNDFIKVKTVKSSFAVNDSSSSCNPFEVKFTNTSVNSVNQEWDFGDGNMSGAFNPTYYYTEPGLYIVTVRSTGYGGCMDSAKMTIELLKSDAIISYQPLLSCQPMEVSMQVNVPGLFKYYWDFGDGSSLATSMPEATHVYSEEGDFVPKMLLTDPTGCLIPVEGVDTVKLKPIHYNFFARDTIICNESPVRFAVYPAVGADVSKLQWSFGDEGGTTSGYRLPDYTYDSPGTYSVQLIATTSYGCSDTLKKNDYIKVNSIPNAAITGDTASCGPDNFSFNAHLITPDTSALTWKWDFDGNQSSISATPDPQVYFASRTFKVNLVVTNSSGCSQILQKTAIVHPIPSVKAGVDTVICLGQSAFLHARGTADTYQWSPATELVCSSCKETIANITSSVMYKVKGTTIYGCENEDSIFVKVNKPFDLVVTASKNSFCAGERVELSASGSEVYSWSPATGLSNPNSSNTSALPVSDVVYTVTASDKEKCFVNKKDISLEVFPLPKVDAGPDQHLSFGNTVTIRPVYSSDIIRWAWSPAGGLSCDNCANPSATLQSSATYTIKVANKNGCESSDQVSLFVPCDANNLFIPNTFSPNGDGVNELFYPMGKGIFKVKSFRVISRWGETVYNRTDFIPNDSKYGWDGIYKGKQASSDVYNYVIEIICSDNITTVYNGTVTLIR